MTTTPDAPADPDTADVPPPPARPLITEPGVYDLTNEEYHSDPVAGGSLSSTMARKLLDCPAKARAYMLGELEETDSSRRTLDLGKAAHAEVLGTGPELYIPQHSGQSNKGKDERREAEERGAVVVTADAFAKITKMADALRQHDLAAELLDPDSGWTEQTIVWRDERTGVMRRAMLDYLPHWARSTGNFLVPDYKGVKSAKPADLERAISTYQWHVQGEYYLDGVRTLRLGGDATPVFLLVCQEKTAPFVVTVVQYGGDERDMARDKIDRAVDLWVDCRSRDHWPGYADEIALCNVPRYEVMQFERDVDSLRYQLSDTTRERGAALEARLTAPQPAPAAAGGDA